MDGVWPAGKVDATGFTVYGNPSDELREVLKVVKFEYGSPIRRFPR